MKHGRTFLITLIITIFIAAENGLDFWETTLSGFIGGVGATTLCGLFLVLKNLIYNPFFKPFKVKIIEWQYDPNRHETPKYLKKIIGIHGLFPFVTIEVTSKISTTIEELNLRFVEWCFYKNGKLFRYHNIDKKLVDIISMQDPNKLNVNHGSGDYGHPAGTEEKIFYMTPEYFGGINGEYRPPLGIPRKFKIWYQLNTMIGVPIKLNASISFKHSKGGKRVTRSRKRIPIIHRTTEEQLRLELNTRALDELVDMGVPVVFKRSTPYIPRSQNQ